MSKGAWYSIRRLKRFFQVIVNKNELIELYKMNFLLNFEHKFDISQLEQLVPYEREIYINLLIEHLDKKKKAKQQKGILW